MYLPYLTFLLALCFCDAKTRMAGGWSPIPDLSADSVVTAANKVAAHFDSNTQTSTYTTIVSSITEGTQQVVAGMNYELTVNLQETSCAKPDTGCPLLAGGKTFAVTARVWVQSWRDFYQVTLHADDKADSSP